MVWLIWLVFHLLPKPKENRKMVELPAIPKRPGRAAVEWIISAISWVVFTFLDLLEVIFCKLYRFLDAFFDENNIPCYCTGTRPQEEPEEAQVVDGGVGEEAQLSNTLYQRKNIFRDLGLFKNQKNRKKNKSSKKKKVGGGGGRWSDCNCQSCGSWQKSGDQKLHLVLKEPSQESNEDFSGKTIENVILLHGHLSSSAFWTETVFPNLSDTGKQNYRLFAVDLFGFGRSPKPWDSLYTLKDHVEMVEKSVISPFHLNSFHIVAHSMGCIIAIAVAAKYLNSVKSIILVAPPYFPYSEEKASLSVLDRLAERRVWPPLLFGASVMSWYEHLGRTVCFIICRNHRIWECILKLIMRKRDVHLMVLDITRHTHHSAWHTMHNVICGGGKVMDECFEAMKKLGVMLIVIQGDKDQVVPFECSYNVKLKVPHAEVHTISGANHSTVIFGREEQFTRDLEDIWCLAAEKYRHNID